MRANHHGKNSRPPAGIRLQFAAQHSIPEMKDQQERKVMTSGSRAALPMRAHAVATLLPALPPHSHYVQWMVGAQPGWVAARVLATGCWRWHWPEVRFPAAPPHGALTGRHTSRKICSPARSYGRKRNILFL